MLRRYVKLVSVLRSKFSSVTLAMLISFGISSILYVLIGKLFCFNLGEKVVVYQPYNYEFYSHFIGLTRYHIALLIFFVNVAFAIVTAIIQRKRAHGITHITFSILWLFLMLFGYDFGFYKASTFDFDPFTNGL